MIPLHNYWLVKNLLNPLDEIFKHFLSVTLVWCYLNTRVILTSCLLYSNSVTMWTYWCLDLFKAYNVGVCRLCLTCHLRFKPYHIPHHIISSLECHCYYIAGSSFQKSKACTIHRLRFYNVRGGGGTSESAPSTYRIHLLKTIVNTFLYILNKILNKDFTLTPFIHTRIFIIAGLLLCDTHYRIVFCVQTLFYKHRLQ